MSKKAWLLFPLQMVLLILVIINSISCENGTPEGPLCIKQDNYQYPDRASCGYKNMKFYAGMYTEDYLHYYGLYVIVNREKKQLKKCTGFDLENDKWIQVMIRGEGGGDVCPHSYQVRWPEPKNYYAMKGKGKISISKTKLYDQQSEDPSPVYRGSLQLDDLEFMEVPHVPNEKIVKKFVFYNLTFGMPGYHD